MKTKLLTDSKQDIITASEILKSGGVVAFPTETIYGLAVNAFDKKAIEKIFKIKNRDKNKAILVLISSLKDIDKLSCDFNKNARKLAKKFWPGPLTIILKKNKNVPDELTANKDTIAVRFTSSKIGLELIKHSGLIITATSANISGESSPIIAKDVLKDLNGKIDAIISSNVKTIGLESTVVDTTSKDVTILREGAIKKEKIIDSLKEN